MGCYFIERVDVNRREKEKLESELIVVHNLVALDSFIPSPILCLDIVVYELATRLIELVFWIELILLENYISWLRSTRSEIRIHHKIVSKIQLRKVQRIKVTTHLILQLICPQLYAHYSLLIVLLTGSTKYKQAYFLGSWILDKWYNWKSLIICFIIP
jgi:hypothetical protein